MMERIRPAAAPRPLPLARAPIVHKPLPARPAAEVPETPKAPPSPKRAVPEGKTRLFINVGEEQRMGKDDIVQLIQEQIDLPAGTIGEVDVRDRHAFVDVASPQATAIVQKVNRFRLGGRRLKVKVA